MLKLYRENYEKNNKVKFKNFFQEEKKKIFIMTTTYGIITAIGIGLLSLTGCGKTTKMEPLLPQRSLEHEINQDNQESIMDFENYDSISLNRFCNDLCCLYYNDDAVSYRTKYEEIVTEKANKWGIDPNLAMAILTQESRSDNTTNLMQIGFNVWQGEPFRVYDFENGKYVDILLTADPVLYNSDKYLTINRKDLENPKTNISIGCAMIQNSMKSMNYDIPAGIQCYNYGPTSMNNIVFAEAYTNSYRTKESLLNDQYDFSFMNYTYAYDKGDNDYFYHVARFLDPSSYSITIKEITSSDTICDHVFDYVKLKREFNKYNEEFKETIL